MSSILATADLHGNLPEIPPCDVLLIGGDICPMDDHGLDRQLRWLDTSFRNWLLHEVPATTVILIAGNHDFIFEQQPIQVRELDLPVTYLQDSGTHLKDLNLQIWGTPWVPNLVSWAFHANQEGLKLWYDCIPKGMDIVLSHGPPWGYGDRYTYSGKHIGCKSATDMLARVKPRALVCGHIHEGFGHYRFNGRHSTTDIYNVSYVDEFYTPRGQIIEIDLSVDVMDDGIEDQADIERPVRDADPDARSASESPEGSESRLLAMASAGDS